MNQPSVQTYCIGKTVRLEGSAHPPRSRNSPQGKRQRVAVCPRDRLQSASVHGFNRSRRHNKLRDEMQIVAPGTNVSDDDASVPLMTSARR